MVNKMNDMGGSSSVSPSPSLFDAVESPDRPERMGQASVEYAESRAILTRATGFMEAYDYTLNPYAGCSFACTYCYAAFFSRGHKVHDWGNWVTVKENAANLLKKEKGKLYGKAIYMSSVTDPYQPLERKLEITRDLLDVMVECQPKLVVQTRSPDVVRDIDYFQQIKDYGGHVQVSITVTTDDEEIRRTFEPYCPSNSQRLRAVHRLCDEGIKTCITMTPLLLVQNPEKFADGLCATGCEKFIFQPFHFKTGKFVAGTHAPAQRLVSEKLGCVDGDFRAKYLEHYEEVRQVLKRALPNLGEGKEGFQPPEWDKPKPCGHDNKKNAHDRSKSTPK
ncbi:MAG: radical SAM protein [Rhodobacteraceae bacterium]|nr:radical SAM protein [Paracoccaceae bacterium]